jgi:hypothetical protein
MILLGLCGCGSAPQGGDAAPAGGDRSAVAAAEKDQHGVRLALLEPSEDSDAAALEGELWVEGKCLYLTQKGSSGGTLLAFLIRDARWDAQRQRLVAHGRSFAPGQRVRLGGSSATNRALLKWRQAPDPSCDARGIMVVGSVDPLP